MKIKLSAPAKWKGPITLTPAYAGTIKAGPGVPKPLAGIRVGKDVGELTHVRSGGPSGGDAVVVSLGDSKECVTDTFRRAGGAMARWLIKSETASAGVDAALVESKGPEALTALTEGFVLGAFSFDEHKSKPPKRKATTVTLLLGRFGKSEQVRVERAVAVSEAANTARRIAHRPPNVLHPVALAAAAKKVAAANRLKCTVLDEKQMQRLEMGALLAVGQGSDAPSRLIVLEYPGQKAGKPVVLVGKAVTFDTGGYSIKTKDGILGMKYDKCGGTAVLGAMEAVAALTPRVPVVGIIGAAENMISGGAYRPDDIITTMSGKTVEIVSADAEGRMVLCDALTYAQRKYKPRAIIDLATLTGGVVVALGSRRGGLFCNHDALSDALYESGERTHERLWRLPIDDDYLEGIKGTDSDLRNSGGRDAHAVLGAMFLKQFIEPSTRWAHLDIAGVATTDKDQAYCPKGATGFGVRLLADYIERLR
ncbi:MAG: leucyl aminopeptidase [bacterium]|nr:leucyl aminopeptidase [bacterium]